MTFGGIAENLISDIIFVLIAIALGWVILVRTRRVHLLKFFGVDTSRRIVIYLSNLRVIPGGAVGIDGRQRSYQGSAAAFGEMQIANRFRDLFNYLLPSLAEKPGIMNKLLISDIQVELKASPLREGQLESSSSFITLGGPAYNVASGYAETKLHSQARFGSGQVDSQPSVPPASSSSSSSHPSSASGIVSSSVTHLPTDEPNSHDEPEHGSPAILMEDVPPITDTTYGFVERIVDFERKRCVFYCAGLSELGTVGATHYLLTEWRDLHRKYGNQDSFVVMLRIEPTDHRKWSIVFER